MDRRLFLTLVLFASTVLFVWALGLLISPFLVPIAWAMCLSAATAKPFRALAQRWNKPRLAAFVMTLLTAFFVLVPAGLVLWMAMREAMALADGGMERWGERLKEVLPGLTNDFRDLIARFGGDPDRIGKDLITRLPQLLWGSLAQGAWELVGKVGAFAIGLFFVLATQYSLYLAGARLRKLLRDVSPLAPERTDQVLEVLRATTVAALTGGVVVALVQGALAGVGYVIAGVPNPVLWGLLTALAALIPIGGAALVWAPALIWVYLTGTQGSAIFLLLWSLLLVSTLDNILRPLLLAKQGGVAIHPLLLLFAVLGGIGLFGVSGIVFGPLLIAFLTTLVYLYREHVAPLLADNGDGKA